MKSCHTDPATPESRPSCCAPVKEAKPSCCGGHEEAAASCCTPGKKKLDWLLWGSLALVAAGIAGHFIGAGPHWWHTFSHGTAEFMSKAWWGLLAGIVAVGVVGRLPQDLVSGLLGKGGSFTGILRATFAGTLLDLCNHGVLMAGAATDYTEIMVLRETTRSWKATLALPLITVPQVLLVAWLLNR